jgi:dTDP-4-dehydrorhamnose 3,5-epimerase
MDVRDTPIPEVKVIVPKRFGDERGWFTETWNAERYAQAGIDAAWIQDNHSFSAARGVVRGLHFQIPPDAQDKLVRCTRGRVLDVAVDIRAGSPTYGQHAAAELTASGGEQIFVPRGFAHGFCTLEENCEVQYKVSGRYAPEHDRGIRWDDADLDIAWPDELRSGAWQAQLSEKDAALPGFADLPEYFTYQQ